ncbi:MAG: hypothetical protein DWQ07_06725 [Chloroflexi bacterium]|nr:MAG: hypothetical protein DWQ07_06725 [Chloroflexota bacterium]MBL1195606.1 hypothetical protein [Chloroflexota bacterium]NOH12893.1 hypothetical protein [Chloroflexota bacterium]
MKAVIVNALEGIRSALNWLVRYHWLSFIIIFLLAFAIRYMQLDKITSRHLTPTANWELSSIAISLMETGEFANPYMLPSGPTAHLPPIYPYLVSFIYRLYGLTPAGGLAAWILMIGSSSALLALLPWLAEKLGIGRQAGFLGGVAWAVLVDWAGHGEYLTGIALGLIMVAFLRRWRTQSINWWGSLLLGLGAGAAFHLQPALLTVVLGLLAFELWWCKGRGKWMHAIVISSGILLACIPWGWRNYTTFGEFFFIRSNFGLELRLGNHEGALATMEQLDALGDHIHPRANFSEARKLRDIGEMAYMQDAQEQALHWIILHPGQFALLTLQRIANVWIGPLHRPAGIASVLGLTLLAIWGFWRSLPMLDLPQRAVLLIPLATFPLVYYFVAYMPRYREPIDWILFMLAGAAVWSWVEVEPRVIGTQKD